jgi:sugar lactone lactonase YvrE
LPSRRRSQQWGPARTVSTAQAICGADIPYGRIFRVLADGTFDLVCRHDGRPNGLAIHRDGRIFVADQKNGIMVLDPMSCVACHSTPIAEPSAVALG